MATLQDKFDELIAKQSELQRQFQKEAQTLFKDVTKEFFELNPSVKAIVWTQYSPYFNDGDECVFGVNCATFTNDEDGEISWGEYDGDKEGIWTYGDDCYSDDSPLPEDFNPSACDAFDRMLQSSEMEDVMEAMFGNHVKVIATREGFDVQDFDHD